MKWKLLQTVTPEWKQVPNQPEDKFKILFFQRTCDQGMELWLNVLMSRWNLEFCFFLSKNKVQGKNKIPELLSLSLQATTMSPNLIKLKCVWVLNISSQNIALKYLNKRFIPTRWWIIRFCEMQGISRLGENLLVS